MEELLLIGEEGGVMFGEGEVEYLEGCKEGCPARLQNLGET